MAEGQARIGAAVAGIDCQGALEQAAGLLVVLGRRAAQMLVPADPAVLGVEGGEGAAAGVRERWTAIASAMPLVDPTLEAAAHASLSRVEHELEHLQWKIVRAIKRRDATLRRQFAHAQTLAFPGGIPQERALGIVYFLNQYGPALIDTLVAELPTQPGTHWIVGL